MQAISLPIFLTLLANHIWCMDVSILSYDIIFQVVTHTEKKEVLESYHLQNGKHLSRDKTFKKVSDHHYWPGMEEDVTEFCHRCEQCQELANRLLSILLDTFFAIQATFLPTLNKNAL